MKIEHLLEFVDEDLKTMDQVAANIAEGPPSRIHQRRIAQRARVAPAPIPRTPPVIRPAGVPPGSAWAPSTSPAGIRAPLPRTPPVIRPAGVPPPRSPGTLGAPASPAPTPSATPGATPSAAPSSAPTPTPSATPAATPSAAPTYTGKWNKFKKGVGIGKDIAVGTIRGVGDLAGATAGAIASPIGGFIGGLKRGYQKAYPGSDSQLAKENYNKVVAETKFYSKFLGKEI